MQNKTFEGRFELKFLAETGTFEGYASVFNVVDRVNDKIAPGAFRKSLARYREEGRLPPLLWQHNALEPIGAWREMYEDDHGLYVKGDLFIHEIALAKEAYKLLRENVVTGLSIGYRTEESHREQKSGVRVLTQLDLLEVSLVTFPANELARVANVKRFFAGEKPTERELEGFLRDAGLSRRQAKGLIAQGYKALAAREEAPACDGMRRFNDALQQATRDIQDDLARRRLHKSLCTAAMEYKYNQSQPRVPAGSSAGGQWTGGGGTGRGQGFGARKVPPKDSGFFQRVNKGPNLPTEQEEEPFGAFGPAGRGGGGNAASRVEGYLRNARQLPEGVTEVGRGADKLTDEQLKSLKSFKSKGTAFKNPEVMHLSDGSAIYSVKIPAKDIPRSYTVWQKQVDASGKIVRTTKTTIGPDNELVHIKPK